MTEVFVNSTASYDSSKVSLYLELYAGLTFHVTFSTALRRKSRLAKCKFPPVSGGEEGDGEHANKISSRVPFTDEHSGNPVHGPLDTKHQ
ncbi:hypothetical protein CRENBAI_007653 [Crenichthys baileyi]|uniref:Uncharacterized protein n=1 Tax=Crenichthys baileyi TaxID=28760 RepID=A0AAV9SF41_9TELE